MDARTKWRIQAPTMAHCQQLLAWMEESYNVALRFWISVDNIDGPAPSVWLYVAGAGELFDQLPPADGIARSRLLSADGWGIVQPLWGVLVQLEDSASKVKKPLLPRPAL